MVGSVSSSSGKSLSISYATREIGQKERRKLALKSLGFFWGLALLSAPLPPIHWLTVPGFFLFGIVSSLRKLKGTTELEPLAFACPECDQKVETKPRPFQKEIQLTCPHCRYLLRLCCNVVA